jgi:hypothetical protein
MFKIKKAKRAKNEERRTKKEEELSSGSATEAKAENTRTRYWT